MKRLVLGILFTSLFSSTMYGQGYFNKIDGCALYYNATSGVSGSSTGGGILLLNNINEVIITKISVYLVFGANKTRIFADTSEIGKIVKTTLKCSK